MSGPAGPQDLQALLARIGEDLDLAAVLREVVACACALADAGRGFIATLDEAGRAVDVASSGLDEAAERRLAEWPDGPRFHTHLRDRPGVLRAADPAAVLGGLGIAADPLPAASLLALALRHRGVHLATVCLFAGGEEQSFDRGRRRTASRPSRHRRRARSPTPGSTATSSGRGPTSRG